MSFFCRKWTSKILESNPHDLNFNCCLQSSEQVLVKGVGGYYYVNINRLASWNSRPLIKFSNFLLLCNQHEKYTCDLGKIMLLGFFLLSGLLFTASDRARKLLPCLSLPFSSQDPFIRVAFLYCWKTIKSSVYVVAFD